MKILIRDPTNKEWIKKEHMDYPSEANLQEILYNNPEIIPIQDITSSSEMSTIKLAVKEVSIPGSVSIDILGLDEFGNKIGKVTFGTGKTFATFRIHIPYKDGSIKLFTITSKGTGNWVSFARLVEKGIDQTPIKQYIIALKSLGFPFDEEKHLARHPEFRMEVLNPEDKFNLFTKETIRLVNSI